MAAETAEADTKITSESDQDAALIAPKRPPRLNRPARLTQPPMRPQRTEFPSPETPRTRFAPAEVSSKDSTTPFQANAPSPIQHPPTPAGTEDSDDFQSAYSTSPRGFDDETNSMDGISDGAEAARPARDMSMSPPTFGGQKPSVLKDLASWTRTRASSTATTATAIPRSPTFSDNIMVPELQNSNRPRTTSKAKGPTA